jgi:hypothetical protein
MWNIMKFIVGDMRGKANSKLQSCSDKCGNIPQFNSRKFRLRKSALFHYGRKPL